MLELDRELQEKILTLKPIPTVGGFFGLKLNKREEEMIYNIIQATSWIHHKIVFIHPFVDGNCRAARLMGNLILEKFKLIGISIKVEKENKNRYRQSLQQIDQMGDYELLENIIVEGLIERYQGIQNRII